MVDNVQPKPFKYVENRWASFFDKFLKALKNKYYDIIEEFKIKKKVFVATDCVRL